MRGKIETMTSEEDNLIGSNPFVHVEKVSHGCFLNGTFRLGVNNRWSKKIKFPYSAETIMMAFKSDFGKSLVKIDLFYQYFVSSWSSSLFLYLLLFP